MKYQISATEYKNKIYSPKLSVELYASVLFKLKYYTTLITQV